MSRMITVLAFVCAVAVASAASAQVTAPTNYWKLDDAANGTRVDATGGLDLTDYASNTAVAAGRFNNGADFEDSNAQQFLWDGTGAGLNPGDIDFSFSVWIKPEHVPLQGRIFVNAAVADGRYQLMTFTDGTIRFSLWASTGLGGQVDAISTTTISAGTLYHIVATYDAAADQMSLWVNGGLEAQATFAGGPHTGGTAYFQVGSHYYYNEPFDGVIDELGYWSGHRLSSAEIAALYNTGSGLPYASFGGSASSHGGMLLNGAGGK